MLSTSSVKNFLQAPISSQQIRRKLARIGTTRYIPASSNLHPKGVIFVRHYSSCRLADLVSAYRLAGGADFDC
jgi:hypothetical protein